ncbi:hypothetical protein JQ557_02670 [Bradyrhizobium sp. U87765 SZCCT0131]|uniref:hypothetical protein n=1 Tax=unclassified Bradyrhizobium TaxID=2631580 RepID=UPI001BA62BD2|nr:MULTISPECIES: hypothetical protein [unclassified Bradyrhizobium]MBR1216879.1 hypothetical protein [Bradyrhizobium sp. U87765 SZCCT0131]MBR1259365.1 hypothetical protein [Bradyrhizobium sp. U87765 SZCCT0134]MBR1305506.1 hypothetical protein [Bradyrhizobium sp. U87765 SZCCT0110]MBR1321873.1 hypothetical protein [Bradyrhizobium sp. U87765 SZCCT0109]MBR1350849.1 hypothetical protein [Bradyrhizobium sp. U87765 SZCCT0048]
MIRDLSTWVGATAVRIGKLWVPSRQAEATLAKYTKQIFCLTGNENYPYSFRGSATTVRIADRCFALWCRHQVRDFTPDNVTIPIEDGTVLVSGSSLLSVEEDDGNADEEFKDICAAEFLVENYKSPKLEKAFFPLMEEDVWRGNSDANFYLFGYPSELRSIDYEEARLHLQQAVTSAEYNGASQARYLHSLKITGKKSFTQDGLSGGPVYHVAKGRDGFCIGLAGIIVRGGNHNVHFVDIRFVLSLLGAGRKI